MRSVAEHSVCRPFGLGQVYIDKKKTIAQGRKIPRDYCVEYPQMQELKEVLEHLGFEFAYEVCSQLMPTDVAFVPTATAYE